MLSKSMILPTLPASDLERARRFYEDVLGLERLEGGESYDGLFFRAGDQPFLVYWTEAPRGGNTALSFVVDDLNEEMDQLRRKGITFEEFETENLKTENGIAEWEGSRGAWFKDSEGNILNLEQPSEEYLRRIRDFAAHALS